MGCCSTKKGGKKKGFTLIEMLIVMIIVGILAAALIPKLSSARGKANDTARKADVQQLSTALISRAMDTNQQFHTLCNIASGGVCDLGAISGTLAGLLTSIPSDEANISSKGLWKGPNATKGGGLYDTTTNTISGGGVGYIMYPITKNGNAGGSFALMAKVETDGAANFSTCSGQLAAGSGDFDTLKSALAACPNGFTKVTSSCTPCQYTDAAQLRYIFLY